MYSNVYDDVIDFEVGRFINKHRHPNILYYLENETLFLCQIKNSLYMKGGYNYVKYKVSCRVKYSRIRQAKFVEGSF